VRGGPELRGIEHVNGISQQCLKGPRNRKLCPSADWWQLLLDGVLVVHWIHAFDPKFEGFALEGELQRWAFQEVDQPGGQFAATTTSRRRRPFVNQKAQYVDPHVTYPCPDSGVVCVVEITAAFWDKDRYPQAYFVLGYQLGIEIGRGGEVQGAREAPPERQRGCHLAPGPVCRHICRRQMTRRRIACARGRHAGCEDPPGSSARQSRPLQQQQNSSPSILCTTCTPARSSRLVVRARGVPCRSGRVCWRLPPAPPWAPPPRSAAPSLHRSAPLDLCGGCCLARLLGDGSTVAGEPLAPRAVWPSVGCLPTAP
jgi:hypothetical protein